MPPVSRVPLFIITPSLIVSKVNTFWLTISPAFKVNIKSVTPPVIKLPVTVKVSPVTYPDPPEVTVTELIEEVVSKVTDNTAPVPDILPVVPKLVYVPAEALTLVNEDNKASAFVDNIPDSAPEGTFDVALEKEPLVTRVTKSDSPP